MSDSDMVPDAIVDDLFTCEVCGKVTDRVRACCYRPTRQRLCDGCYLGGKGDHSSHVGQVHDMMLTPREHLPYPRH